ncbi:MAG TPA: nitroreductase family protein [Anaerolineales bacterium]|nr:nitroreductase family protein [Anaerolineales bacterium]
MDVAEAIRTKRAIREFAADPLSADEVAWILRAGRRAQSAKNRQPWQFIAIQDRETLEALSRTGTYAGHLAHAALGVVLATPDPAERWSILFDAGQAAAYMQLAAWERGVGSCLATIYEQEQARTLLGVPKDVHLPVALSFGRPLHPEQMTAAPRRGGRRPFAEMVHWDRW